MRLIVVASLLAVMLCGHAYAEGETPRQHFATLAVVTPEGSHCTAERDGKIVATIDSTRYTTEEFPSPDIWESQSDVSITCSLNGVTQSRIVHLIKAPFFNDGPVCWEPLGNVTREQHRAMLECLRQKRATNMTILGYELARMDFARPAHP